MGDIVDTSRQDLYQVVAKHGVKGVADAGCKENFTLLVAPRCGGENAIALLTQSSNSCVGYAIT